ncbi:membrane protein [Clostridia bacterium]|nr:membrane protein [Clostridia bacterium]
MKRIAGFDSDKKLALFFAVTLLWTWAFGMSPVFFGITGTPLGTFLFYFGGGAPSIVAVVIILRTWPKSAIRSYFVRCLRFRGPGWKILLFLVLFFAAASAAAVLFGTALLDSPPPEMAWIKILAARPYMIIPMLLISLISGPLNEELGWRGYAQDRLTARYGLYKGTVILGLAWGVWHLAWFFTPGQAQHEMAQRSVWECAMFFVFVVAQSFVVSFAYVSTRRSILAGAFAHMMCNFLTSQLLAPFSGPMRLSVMLSVTVFSIALVVYMIRSRKFKEAYRTAQSDFADDRKRYGSV